MLQGWDFCLLRYDQYIEIGKSRLVSQNSGCAERM